MFFHDNTDNSVNFIPIHKTIDLTKSQCLSHNCRHNTFPCFIRLHCGINRSFHILPIETTVNISNTPVIIMVFLKIYLYPLTENETTV